MAAMADQFVRVNFDDYPQFERDLRRLNKDYVRILRKQLREAAKPIVTDIRNRYRAAHPRRGGGRRRVTAGNLAQVRRGRAGQISVVGNKSRSIGWLRPQEFGVDAGERDTLGRPLASRFPVTRPSPVGSGPASHFFFVAGYEGREEASRKIVAAIDQANRGVFPDSP